MAYTTIDDPSAHFQVATWTGDGEATQAIVFDGNSDLKPDLFWAKGRNVAYNHIVLDTSRTFRTQRIIPNSTDAEDSHNYFMTSNDSDGFTTDDDVNTNQDAKTYVAWCWKANDGTTSSNTTGDINTTVQVNSDAGFSIITYTGNNTDDQTIGHGLGAVPGFAMFKSRAGAAGTGNWNMTHSAFSGTEYIFFTDAATASANNNFKSTPTSTIFTLGDSDVNEAETIICYAWTPIQGFSKFGSYEGNGNADGPFVYTGFKPAYVMVKNTTASRDWIIITPDVQGYNPHDDFLRASTSGAEVADDSGARIDFLSNGFKLRGNNSTINDDGDTHIYISFAHQPLVTSGGVPCTAG